MGGWFVGWLVVVIARWLRSDTRLRGNNDLELEICSPVSVAL